MLFHSMPKPCRIAAIAHWQAPFDQWLVMPLHLARRDKQNCTVIPYPSHRVMYQLHNP